MAKRENGMISVVLRLDSAFILTHTQLYPSSTGTCSSFKLEPCLPVRVRAETCSCTGSGNKSVKALFVCISKTNASFSSYFKGFLFSWSNWLYLKLHTGTLSVYLFIHLFSPEVYLLIQGLFVPMSRTSLISELNFETQILPHPLCCH